jgi:hypothetical protein
MVEEKQKKAEITKEELLSFIKQTLQPTDPQPQPQQPIPPYMPPMQQPIQPPFFINPMDSQQQNTIPITSYQEKRVIAQAMMKLHKNIIILSLMLITIPLITAFVAVIDPIIAIAIPMISVIYPVWLYTQSNKNQMYLSHKYNLPPIMSLKRHNIIQNENRGIDPF